MFSHIWQVPDGHVASGRIPGYVGAVRLGGVKEIRARGVKDLDGPAMREDTLFRIASLTKPIGGALSCCRSSRISVFALDDPVGQWLPEVERAAGAGSTPAGELDLDGGGGAADHDPPARHDDLRLGRRLPVEAPLKREMCRPRRLLRRDGATR